MVERQMTKVQERLIANLREARYTLNLTQMGLAEKGGDFDRICRRHRGGKEISFGKYIAKAM